MTYQTALKRKIINLAIGSQSSWYHKGQSALRSSLLSVGEQSTAFCSRGIIGEEDRNPYVAKVSYIEEMSIRYDTILWLDCSITAIRPLDDIWNYIESKGVYLYQSGANCSETCNDNCLAAYGITRDEAEHIPECASNVVGINLAHPAGRRFFFYWTQSLKNGANLGVKWPTEEQRLEESKDPRFKYHRQDQSSASLAAHLAGVKLEPEGHFVVRHENLEYHKGKDSIIFVLKGGVGE